MHRKSSKRFLAKHIFLSYNGRKHWHKRARRSSYHEMGFMKILTLSDTVVDLVHSSRIAERFRDVDLVLSCGDLPWEYLEFVVTMLAKRVLYVYGNHAQKNVWDGVHEIRSVAPGGCENVHRRVVNHDGLLIAGLEGSMRYNEGEHQYTQNEMDWLVRALSPKLWWNERRYGRAVDILMTHAPPYGIHDGADLCHQGFRAFLRFMDRYKPRYLIHGHTHLYRLDAKRVTQYGETTIINTYGYQVIEIDIPLSASKPESATVEESDSSRISPS